MKSFRQEVADLETVRQELANAEKLFDLPITMYPDLLEVQKQMKGLEMIYSLYEEQLVSINCRISRFGYVQEFGQLSSCFIYITDNSSWIFMNNVWNMKEWNIWNSKFHWKNLRNLPCLRCFLNLWLSSSIFKGYVVNNVVDFQATCWNSWLKSSFLCRVNPICSINPWVFYLFWLKNSSNIIHLELVAA